MTKLAPISYWQCPKAAIAVFGEGGLEKRKNKALLTQTPVTPKPHSTQAYEHHNQRVSLEEEQREDSGLGSFPLHLEMHPLL